MKLLQISILLCMLTGCGTAVQRGDAAFFKGDFVAAESHFRSAVNNGNPNAWTGLGVALYRQGKTGEAIEAFKMGARWGEPNARRILKQRGIPLPAMDLYSDSVRATVPARPANSQESSADVAAGAQLLLNLLGTAMESRNSTRTESLRDAWPSSTTITCESRDTSINKNMNGTVITTCR